MLQPATMFLKLGIPARTYGESGGLRENEAVDNVLVIKVEQRKSWQRKTVGEADGMDEVCALGFSEVLWGMQN